MIHLNFIFNGLSHFDLLQEMLASPDLLQDLSIIYNDGSINELM